SSGTHTITASVSDSVGRTATAQMTVRVNAPPHITITAPAPGTSPEPHAAVTFSATALDLEDGDLSSGVSWPSSHDGAPRSGAILVAPSLSSGTHVITASVTDSGGKRGTASITMVVNATPTVSISGPAVLSFEHGAPITFTASASDPEDGNLNRSIVWTSDRD